MGTQNVATGDRQSFIPKETESLDTGLITAREGLEEKATEEELVQLTKAWLTEAKPLHDEIAIKQKRNQDYYLGDQLDTEKLGEYQAKIVDNKIFQNLETLTPIASASIPSPVATMPPTEDEAEEIDFREYEQNLEETMLSIAEENKIGLLFEDFVRYQQIYMLAVLKFGVEDLDGGGKQLWVELLRPQRILLPPDNSGEYVIEHHRKTAGELIKRYPQKKAEIEALTNKSKSKNGLGTRFGYWEVTTDEKKWWVLNDIILSVIDNPHYDKKGENHWKKARKDYIFSDLHTFGINQYSQTTLINQSITLQDAVNKRKRQISDNADHANGLIVAYAQNQVTKEEVAAVEAARAKPNSVVFLENAVSGAVQHFKGQSLDPFVFQDMQHTIGEIDNIWGTHSNLRGERTPGEETFGGRRLLKGADENRIGGIAKMLDRAAEELFNAFAQMIKVHFKKAQYIPYLGRDGSSKQVKIEAGIIKDGLIIKVRQGSSLVKDKAAESQEALTLWQNKAIDPISLYERIGEDNPLKTAERLFEWLSSPETLFSRVAKDYEAATKSKGRKKVLESLVQADMENRQLIQGQPLPPFEEATIQHIAIHDEVMRSDEFAALPLEQRQAMIEHVKGEIGIVRAANLAEREKQKADSIENRIKFDSKGPQV